MRFFLLIVLFSLAWHPSLAREVLPGPVEAHVLKVNDGDTFVAEVRVWPGQTVRVHVRIRGIDAPEMKGRCAFERLAARRARAELARLIGGGPVRLSNIGGGKYFGRVLADVASGTVPDLAPVLLGSGAVRAYAGGKRAGWCG